jgi:hypothetical protein
VETLVWLTAGVALMLGAGWVHTESRWRWRWQGVPRGERPGGPEGGVYREATAVPVYLAAAPRDVRLVSLGAVMTVALLMVAMLGFVEVFGHEGSVGEVTSLALLLWSPSAMVAVRLLRDGLALLRRESRPAGVSAAGLATWALLSYVALLTGMTLLLQLLSTMVYFPADPPGHAWAKILLLMMLLFAWPLTALAQALLNARVAARHRADLL